MGIGIPGLRGGDHVGITVPFCGSGYAAQRLRIEQLISHHGSRRYSCC